MLRTRHFDIYLSCLNFVPVTFCVVLRATTIGSGTKWLFLQGVHCKKYTCWQLEGKATQLRVRPRRRAATPTLNQQDYAFLSVWHINIIKIVRLPSAEAGNWLSISRIRRREAACSGERAVTAVKEACSVRASQHQEQPEFAKEVHARLSSRAWPMHCAQSF
eukprot:1146009-Pelagomonas_calceolata.AAC.2